MIEGENSGRSSLQVSIQKIIRIEFEIELERKRNKQASSGPAKASKMISREQKKRAKSR